MSKPLPDHLRNFDDVAPGGGGSKKPPEGTYDITLGLMKYDTAQSTEEPYFIAEFTIDEIITGGKESKLLRAAAGDDAPFVPEVVESDECAFFQGFKWKKSARGAIKALMMAAYSVALGEVQSPTEVGDDELAAAIDEEEQVLAGTKLRLVVGAKLTKDKTGYRPTYKWMPRPDDPLYASMSAGTGDDSDD
jgi:hypothetical protein